MKTHLSLKNIHKSVGQTTILNDVSIDIAHGEFLVVVGPSGCGKSTLMRLVAGLDEISAGEILMDQKSINNTPAAQRDMAMVFQSYALYPHMTVFDNMAYSLKLRKYAKTDIVNRVHETAKLLRLMPYLDRKPSELSGGQKQRVAMGRAMIRSPSVFLFDEPLSNLDAKLRTEMRHEIKKLHQKFKTTSIYVTHDQTEAMTMADRILVLNQGCIEQIGTPQELYQRPESVFVAGFMGHYPINFIPAKVDKDTIVTDLGVNYPLGKNNSLFVDNQELILGIRPEHVQLAKEPHDMQCQVRVEFIDDMGADRLVQAACLKSGLRLQFRLHLEEENPSERFTIELLKPKIHVFAKDTGKRLGELE